MGYYNLLALPAFLVLLYVTSYGNVEGCNEAVCGSMVSKCLLLKSCECDLTDKSNCTCCRHCHKCLAKLYTECCSCVGMCPHPDPKEEFEKLSTVEQLTDPVPELFNVLTEEDDALGRWKPYTYPAHHDLLYFRPGHTADMDVIIRGADGSEQRIRHGQFPNTDGMNCTVAYMSQCMPLNKCKKSCKSMGAARYRWFHEHGCCECIGSTCLDYGKGEALCMKCPLPEDEEDEEEVEVTNEMEGGIDDGIDGLAKNGIMEDSPAALDQN